MTDPFDSGFSPEWDDLYRASQHLSIWPWSELISLVMREARPADGFTRVLELGCGAGANIPFFVRLGVDYWAIEGSVSAVGRLRQLYPSLAGRIVAGDFTRTLPGTEPFDLIVDRSSVTHNTTAAIGRALALVSGRLRPGGLYIGIDWFADDHDDRDKGQPVDRHSRRDLTSGGLAATGIVHFSDLAHLRELLETAGLTLERCDHKTIEVVVPAPARLAFWNFVARKR